MHSVLLIVEKNHELMRGIAVMPVTPRWNSLVSTLLAFAENHPGVKVLNELTLWFDPSASEKALTQAKEIVGQSPWGSSYRILLLDPEPAWLKSS